MPIFIKDNDSQCFSFKVYSFSLTLPAPDSINQGPLLEMFKELFYLINHCCIAELLHGKCSLLHNIYYTQSHDEENLVKTFPVLGLTVCRKICTGLKLHF